MKDSGTADVNVEAAQQVTALRHAASDTGDTSQIEDTAQHKKTTSQSSDYTKEQQTKPVIDEKDKSEGDQHTYITCIDESTGFQYYGVLDKSGALKEIDITTLPDPNPPYNPTDEIDYDPTKDVTDSSDLKRPILPTEDEDEFESNSKRMRKSPIDIEVSIKGSPIRVQLPQIVLNPLDVRNYITSQNKNFASFQMEQLVYIEQQRLIEAANKAKEKRKEERKRKEKERKKRQKEQEKEENEKEEQKKGKRKKKASERSRKRRQ